MKTIFGFLTIVLISYSSYAQKIEFENIELKNNLPDWVLSRIERLKIDNNLKIDNSLNPFYIESDLNGDNIVDIAIFVTDKELDKKGLLIIHGASFNEIFLLGAGNSFSSFGDDFKWLKSWKLYRQNFTFFDISEIDKSKPKKIEYPSLLVASSGSYFKIIVWNGKEYTWVDTDEVSVF